MRADLKVGLWRVSAALLMGLFLGPGFMYLFLNTTPHAAESVGEFIGRMFGLGFEGAAIVALIMVVGTVVIFSLASWAILRKWGPLRRQARQTDL